jgi:excisionase family DNA binding protein
MQHNVKTGESLWKKPDVCQRLNISLRTLNYRLAEGTIPHVRIGGSIRFVPNDIRNLEKSHRVGGTNKSATRKG